MGRCYEHLKPEERGKIAALLMRNEPKSAIARALGRSVSTISRELGRNGYREAGVVVLGRPPQQGYDPVRAGQRAQRLRRRPRRLRKLRKGQPLWRRVQRLLKRRWSPQQIAGKLRGDYPQHGDRQVSHQTIYNAIYAMPRGHLRREMTRWLRQKRAARRRSDGSPERRGKLADLPSIHTRPEEAEERQVPGHWEGDLIRGAYNRSAVGTLVDRSTLFVLLVRMKGATADDALEGYSRAFNALPTAWRKTLTYDQGKEMVRHRELTQRTGIQVYFADPHSPWQRGINENINGLLREYLPKGEDLSVYSQRQLNRIAHSLNTRPRKTLGYRAPMEVFYEKCGLSLEPADLVALRA
jgi:transposase, IS30 family